METIKALMEDLRALRRGLGVNDPYLPTRAGATLRRVCGVHDGDRPAVAREKITVRLQQLIARLPEAARVFAATALGFTGPPGARYTARLESLASTAERELRTLQRRADQALYQLAELACGGDEPPRLRRDEPPWHTKLLRVSVILGGPRVEVLETRRIVSHLEGLSEIEHSVTVAPTGRTVGPLTLDDVSIEAIGGGEVHSLRLVSSSRVAFSLRPPRVLNTLDEHEFFFRVWVPTMPPFYCCTPVHACDRFELRVRFGPDGIPARLWLVDGELPLEAGDPMPVRKAVVPDVSGEVELTFEHLEPARSYGIGWSPRG